MGIYNSGSGAASEDNSAYIASLGARQLGGTYSNAGMGGSYGASMGARRMGIMPGVNPSSQRMGPGVGVGGANGLLSKGANGPPISASPRFRFEAERRNGLGVRPGAAPSMSAVAAARMQGQMGQGQAAMMGQRPGFQGMGGSAVNLNDPRNAVLAAYGQR